MKTKQQQQIILCFNICCCFVVVVVVVVVVVDDVDVVDYVPILDVILIRFPPSGLMMDSIWISGLDSEMKNRVGSL